MNRSRLTLINAKEVKQGKNWKGKYLCECGKETITFNFHVKTNRIVSCGCEYAKTKVKFAEEKTKHGLCKDNPRLFSIWDGVKQRCYNPKSSSFKNYGARQIVLCEEWLNFENFCNWSLQNGYTEDLSIDRKDYNGIYSPDNCRWVTDAEQNRNTRVTLGWEKVNMIRKKFKNGKSRKELAEEYNVARSCISRIITNKAYSI